VLATNEAMHAAVAGAFRRLKMLLMAMGLHKRGACASEGVIMQFLHGAGGASARSTRPLTSRTRCVCVCVRACACVSHSQGVHMLCVTHNKAFQQACDACVNVAVGAAAAAGTGNGSGVLNRCVCVCVCVCARTCDPQMHVIF
jgi:hypothetical protein